MGGIVRLEFPLHRQSVPDVPGMPLEIPVPLAPEPDKD